MATVVTLGLLALSQLEHVSSATTTSFKQKKEHRQCHINPRNYRTVD